MNNIKHLLLVGLFTCTSAVLAKVNINTANFDELSALSGIGEAKAAAIIEYREEHGEFASVDELTKVKGIGQATLDKLRMDLSVKGKTDLSDVKNLSK